MSIGSVAGIITTRNPSIVVDTRINDLISLATQQTGAVFGNNQDDAIALLVLHWLELESRGGAGGAISSEKEGDLARTYAISDSGDDDLKSTKWGLMRLRLQRAYIFGPRNRMM